MLDAWEFYLTTLDERPASIYVDMTYSDEAPIAGRGELSWLRVYFQMPSDDGLSSSEESQRLFDIEDSILAILRTDEQFHYVGRNTCGGYREFFCYTADGPATASRLGLLMGEFPDYKFETGQRKDVDWSAYRNFLFPSPRDMQYIKNRHVIAVLKEQNDAVSVPRVVSHWAYFSDEDTRDRYIIASEHVGFTLDRRIPPEDPQGNWGAVMTREDAVDFWTIGDVTLQLYDLAAEHGGKYDGWETPIVLASD